MANCNHDKLKAPYCPECGAGNESPPYSLLLHLRSMYKSKNTAIKSLKHYGRKEDPRHVAGLERLDARLKQIQGWISFVEKHLP